MAVDWGLAGQVAGLGYLLIFAVLLAIAFAIWFMGFLIRRVSREESPKNDKTPEKG